MMTIVQVMAEAVSAASGTSAAEYGVVGIVTLGLLSLFGAVIRTILKDAKDREAEYLKSLRLQNVAINTHNEKMLMANQDTCRVMQDNVSQIRELRKEFTEIVMWIRNNPNTGGK